MANTKGSLPKVFIRSQNWWQIFLCKIRNLPPNSFLPEQFFIFFSFNIVCQLLARHLSKEIKTMKIYSDRLKPLFAQITPSFTCTYLALVFSVNKWKSIPVKNLLHAKKIGGYWLHTKHYSNIPVFLASTKVKNHLNASERFQFGKYIKIITKKFYQVTELMTEFPMQDSKPTSKQFFTRTVFIFFLASILFVSYWLVTFYTRKKFEKLFR